MKTTLLKKLRRSTALASMLLLIGLMAPLAVKGQTSFTVNCYPPSETYATGYTNGSTKTSGEMHCVSNGGVQGWMKFDVSSIPDFATISSIKLYFYNTSTSNSWVKLTAAGQYDPVNTSASTLYSAITTDSPNYYTSTYISGLSSAGWKNFTLSSSAVSNLQSPGLTNDYFTIGFYEYESSSGYSLYTYGYDNSTYRPYIEVTYTASINTMQCGQTYSGTLGTSGNWTTYTGCSYQDKGEEHIYAYTPFVTGSYTFTGAATSGDPDFWLMESCSNTATNMLGSSSSCWDSGTRTATLTAGHTYYLIVDNYSNSSNAGYEISVECHSFNIDVWTNGNGTVSGGGTYTEGSSCTITATPSSGYVFDGWILNGTQTINTNPYTFTVTDIADFQAVFSTDPCPVTTFPWNEDFESMTASTVPSCWDNSASTSTTLSNNPERIWGVYAYNSNKMLRMYNFYVRQGTALINTPSITLPAAPQEFSFDYSHLASCGTFYVKISQDGGTTFTNLWSHGANSTSYDYTDPGTFNTSGTIDLSAYANSTVIIQFYAEADYGSGAIFVDNINIASSCPAPTGLALSGITTQAVTATWNAAAGDEFDYAIVSGANVNPATVTTYEGSITASGSTCSKTWSNLSSDSDYTVVIRKVCGNNDYSQPVSLSFTTEASNCPKPTNVTVSNLAASHATVSWTSEAGNYTVKYSTATVSGTTLDPVFEDGFENGLDSWTTYAMGYDNSSYNWQQYDLYTAAVEPYNHSGSYVAMSRSWVSGSGDQSVDNWLVTPQMTLGDVVKFWVSCNEDFRDSYAVYVSTGSNVVTSSTSIGDFVLVKSYAEATGTWTEIPIDISAYAGQQGYIAIRHTNYGGDKLNVDDFGVYNTINTYSYGGWTTVSPNPTTESCQITGLSAETLYAVQVQANCGGSDGSSAWSTIYFTTPDNCGAPQELASSNVTATSATLSWSDDKDSYNLQYRKVYFYEDFEGSDGIPTGWTTINNSSTAGTLNWQVLHMTNHSGNNSVGSGSYIYQNTGITPDNWLISPQLDLQGTLRVWLSGYPRASSNYSEHFEILLSTTGTSVSDFTTTLVAESTTTNSYVEYTADLSSYSGKGYIAIHHFNCSDQNYLCVDDFGIYGSENWVTLTPNPTTETANLTGLTAGTDYEWQVQGINCDGSGGLTDWSAPATFTTERYRITASANPAAGGTVSFMAGPANSASANLNTHLPSDSYYDYGLSEQIYTPAEIGGGTISSIAFYSTTEGLNSGGVEFTRTYDIYMVHTDKSSFANTTDWIPVTSSDKVFTGTVTYVNDAWTTITLDTPFAYDGVHNLAIIMDDNYGTDYSAGNYLQCKTFTPTAGGNCSMYVRGGTNYNPTNTSSLTADELLTVKNQILVNGSATRTFPENASCTLVATPNTNYHFVNWTESNSPVSTSETYSFTVTADRTLVANFALDEYTITYDLVGGEMPTGVTNPSTYTVETTTFTLNNPTKTGYTFVGWTGSNGSTPQTTVTITQGTTGNLSYTANWNVDTYNITYNLAGGEMPSGVTNPSTYTIETTTFTLNNPTRTGYTFAGWTGTDLSSATTTVTITQGSTGDRSYTATWTADSYTITYDLVGGEMPTGVTNPSTYTVETTTFTLNNPTKTGYTFAGWTGSNGSTPQTTVTITQGTTGNLSYTANWNVDTYNITYNLAGGEMPSGVTNPSTYTIETTTFTLNNPTRTGYTFAGWTGTDLSSATTTVTITQGSTGDRSYTATWTGIPTWATHVTEAPSGFSLDNIDSPEDLAWVISLVNGYNGVVANASVAKDVTITADLDMSNYIWVPIGESGTPYLGTFDGGFHTISGLHIDDADEETAAGNKLNTGLFGLTDSDATIKNLYVKGAVFVNDNASGNLGGIVGNNGGTVQNCYSDATLSGTATNKGGIAGANTGTLSNSYTMVTSGVCGNNTGDIDYCYNKAETNSAPDAGEFTTAELYSYGDYTTNNAAKEGSTLKPLVDWLNTSNPDNTVKWIRPKGSSKINGGYPVLVEASSSGIMAVVGVTGDNNIYKGNANSLISTYSSNSNADIYVYSGGELTNHSAAAHLFIDENVGVTQSAATNPVTATVGITMDNSTAAVSSGDLILLGRDYHTFSSPLVDAPTGITYLISTQYAQSVETVEGTHYSVLTTDASYFPSGVAGTNFDLYDFYEPQYHWINLKRNGASHWQEDSPTTHIDYDPGTTFKPGKGYLLAIGSNTDATKEVYMSATGVLYNDEPTDIAITANGAHLVGYNFLGNPYQSYLDFNTFASVNASAIWGSDHSDGYNAYLIYDADKGGFDEYLVDATSQTFSQGSIHEASRYIHPHQGFFIIKKGAGTSNVSFTNGMRVTDKGSAYRNEQPNYPLVNLICTDENGKQERSVVEVERPVAAGSLKAKNLLNGNANMYIRLNGEDFSNVFVEGMPEYMALWLEVGTVENSTFTLTWSTANDNFGYLHLVDNLTGNDIDMLATDSYSFQGKRSDSKARFRLMFSALGIEEETTEQDANFAFISGSELIVTGEGELSFIDLNGRVLATEYVSGQQSHIAMPKVAVGMYMLRLTNSDGVKVQKIVVRK